MLQKEKNQRLKVKKSGIDDWPEDQQWSTEEGKWEAAGEQGALCVSSAASARAAMEAQPPQQRPFNKKELELLKTQKDFVMGKI